MTAILSALTLAAFAYGGVSAFVAIRRTGSPPPEEHPAGPAIVAGYLLTLLVCALTALTGGTLIAALAFVTLVLWLASAVLIWICRDHRETTAPGFPPFVLALCVGLVVCVANVIGAVT